MARQEILIYLQNMIKCLEFLMGPPGFQHNQIYKYSHIYNENEYQVHNECILMNGNGSNKKSTLLKLALYPSEY